MPSHSAPSHGDAATKERAGARLERDAPGRPVVKSDERGVANLVDLEPAVEVEPGRRERVVGADAPLGPDRLLVLLQAASADPRRAPGRGATREGGPCEDHRGDARREASGARPEKEDLEADTGTRNEYARRALWFRHLVAGRGHEAWQFTSPDSAPTPCES